MWPGPAILDQFALKRVLPGRQSLGIGEHFDALGPIRRGDDQFAAASRRKPDLTA